MALNSFEHGFFEFLSVAKVMIIIPWKMLKKWQSFQGRFSQIWL
jgi:hypothetical protein